MAILKTRHGTVSFSNWGYQLQGKDGAPLTAGALAKPPFDLLVTDFSRDGSNETAFSKADVARMIKGDPNRVLVSYISIGEVTDFRNEWSKSWTKSGAANSPLTAQSPDWVGPVNPDYPESRKVRYWDKDWQDAIFNPAKTGWLDKIVANGFDAAYLDIVDAFDFWPLEARAADKHPGDPKTLKDAAQRMADFIVDMTAHARETNPKFFSILQNGENIIEALGSDTVRKKALLGAAGGIAVEDLYFFGSKPEDNAFSPDKARIANLKHDFLANGKFVLAVDYLKDPKKIDAFARAAVSDGFMPTVAPDRDLDRPSKIPLATKPTDKDDLWLGDERANVFSAGKGNDVLNGLAGKDRLSGGEGNDKIFGSFGNDRLSGGAGRDIVSGGDGRDTFVFRAGDGRDVISDFQNGLDRLDLTGLADSFAEVKAAASVKGDHIVLTFGADSIEVHGLTLASLTAGDVIF
jgi:cysteinyl-tRNA synthetase, unknown class